jgi:hypothetical protein
VNATTGAVTLYLDDFFLGPETVSIGPAMSDWTSFPMVITGSVSNPTKGTASLDNAQWRQVGDSMEIMWNYAQTAGGSDGSGYYLFALPPGYTIDSTKTTISANNSSCVGTVSTFDGISSYGSGQVQVLNSTHLILWASSSTSDGVHDIGSAYYQLSLSNLTYAFIAKVPIAGWSSNTVQSNDSDDRIVSAKVFWTSTGALSPNAYIPYDTVLEDTHAAFNLTSHSYVIPVSGDYYIMVHGAHETPSIDCNLSVVVNGVRITGYLQTMVTGKNGGSGFTMPGLHAGDVINITNDTAVTFVGSSDSNFMTIFRLSGPAVVQSTALVAAKYVSNTSQALTTGQIINYEIELFDTHAAVTTGVGAWRFKAPLSGIYQVSATDDFGGTATNTNLMLYKNGVVDSILGTCFNNYTVGGQSTLISLNTGDYIDIRLDGSGTIDASNPQTNQISIHRIK